MSLKLELISKKPSELLKIAKWRNETLISLRSNFRTPVDIDHQYKWIDSIFNSSDVYFFIYDDTKFIGYSGLDKLNKVNKTAELGLLIGKPHQGQNYGKKATISTLAYAFDILKLNCVFIEVYLTTDTWINFWHNLGFKKEGILRQRKFWSGKFYDSVTASMLKEEFYKLYGKDTYV